MTSADRLFFGVALNPGAAGTVAARQGKLVDGKTPIRLVPEENLHLTARFIGNCSSEDRERILGGIDVQALPFSFPIRLKGWGAFPRPAAAKVVWIGVDDPAGGLAALHAVTDRAAVLAGFPAENRPYRPHLTLGRLRAVADVRPLLSAADQLDIEMVVSRFTLFRSISGSGHPRYDPICSFRLSGHESLRVRESSITNTEEELCG